MPYRCEIAREKVACANLGVTSKLILFREVIPLNITYTENLSAKVY